MPIIKSAKKAARQATKRTEHNVEIKKTIKAALKAFKTNPTSENLAKAQSEYDKAVKKDLMKKNTAARRKAKLYEMAKAAGVKLTKKTAKTPAKTTAKKVPAKTETKTTAKKAVTKKTQPKAKATAK